MLSQIQTLCAPSFSCRGVLMASPILSQDLFIKEMTKVQEIWQFTESCCIESWSLDTNLHKLLTPHLPPTLLAILLQGCLPAHYLTYS